MYFTKFHALEAFLMYRLVKIIFAILAFLIPIGFIKGDNAIATLYLFFHSEKILRYILSS